MTESVRITLQPLGEIIEADAGTPLREILFDYGVEYPCGGRGQCRGCRIRVVKGNLPVTPPQREVLTSAEIDQGWRLSCQCQVEGDLTLEMAQWKADILSDESPFEFAPRPGFGVAVDLGTTTLVAQLLDLETGKVLGVRTALNDQARHGSDVMSRIEFAVAGGGHEKLMTLIRDQIGELITQVLSHARKPAGDNGTPHPAVTGIAQVVIVGNTVMHHLFSGIDLEPLSRYPFEPPDAGLKVFSSSELGWDLEGNPPVHFLPCPGGFVGSDILAGILAVKMHESHDLIGLVDLGTNGEIVIGNRDGILCASTAAGPAFEGARIAMGMRAATGAVYQVKAEDGAMKCAVLGHARPRGICGSGLVDAAAAGLDLGWILPAGRLNCGSENLMVMDPVALTQTDIRQLQLAKGAIAAGITILLDRLGASRDQVRTLYLAGAFGNYISKESARRIGLLDFPSHKVHPAGNTALLGAKMALFQPETEAMLFSSILGKTEHISLSADARFMDIYVDEMGFPASS